MVIFYVQDGMEGSCLQVWLFQPLGRDAKVPKTYKEFYAACPTQPDYWHACITIFDVNICSVLASIYLLRVP